MKAGITVVSVLMIMTFGIVSFGTDYTITNLGTLPGGGYSAARGVNDLAQVVGYARAADGQEHAFLWQNGVMTDLGTFGGSSSAAYRINKHGQIVGRYVDGIGHGYVWHNGNLRVLNSSDLFDINDAGQAVGVKNSRAIIWNPDGSITDVGLLPGYPSSFAFDINTHGEVVGFGWNDTEHRAFYWQNGVMQDLGTLGGTMSEARGINDSKQIVGISNFPGWGMYDYHGFYWQDGQMLDIGTLGGFMSSCWSINNQGIAVGYSTLYADKYQRAITVEVGPGKTDLNDKIPAGSGWTLFYAHDISNSGLIVGMGRTNEGDRGFLLTPISEPSNLVGITNRDAHHSIISMAKDNFQFRMWGRVLVIDGNKFTIDDGSGLPVEVLFNGHNLISGNYVVVEGKLSGSNPPVLTANAVRRLN